MRKVTKDEVKNRLMEKGTEMKIKNTKLCSQEAKHNSKGKNKTGTLHLRKAYF